MKMTIYRFLGIIILSLIFSFYVFADTIPSISEFWLPLVIFPPTGLAISTLLVFCIFLVIFDSPKHIIRFLIGD